ncbi:MAG: type II toxin-antitoxin system YafQ family toxin [Candidatus Paceibacterota bacterium]|jgi:mRNA interferase YafQ
MHQIKPSRSFRKSYKRIVNSGRPGFIKATKEVVDELACGKILDIKYKDHALNGEYAGYRECHIKPDLLLIYKLEKGVDTLFLTELGSHSEIFGL